MAGSGIKNSELLDLLATTLPDLPDNEFEVAWDYRDYEVCNRWFKSDKIEVDGGVTIDRRIMLDDSGTARYVRLYEPSTPNVVDVQKKISVPWCQLETSWSIERREILRNRSSAKGFIKMLQVRRVDSMVSLANLLEEKAWATPNDASDDSNPLGLPYWICLGPDGTNEDGSFNGQTVRYGDGSTGTVRAGLDSSTYEKWRNWTAQYTAVNRTLIKRMRKAFRSVRFKSPVVVKDMTEGPSSNFRIYMPLDVAVEFEEIAHGQNDNLGGEIAAFGGATTFRRVPLIDIPQLDTFTVTDGGGNSFSPEPIFMVNHGQFYPIVQEDDWLVESDPETDRTLHNVFTTFVDGSHQFMSSNLRTCGAVLHRAIPAS
jgi:hypothetical protein